MLDEGVVEAGAPGREGVDRRGLHDRVAEAADRVGPLLVGHEPHEIRAIGHLGTVIGAPGPGDLRPFPPGVGAR